MAIPKLNKETNLFKPGAIPSLVKQISEAQIKVSADGILAEVRKKVGADEIISCINQTAEAVRIAASKIDIAGTITAINGDTTTTIDGGKIAANSIVVGKLASAVQAAIGKAGDYLTTVDGTGVLVHPAGDETTGWSIRDALELLKSGVSCFKVWADGAVAKVRVGAESAAHILLQGSGIAMLAEGTTVASVAANGVTLGSRQRGNVFFEAALTRANARSTHVSTAAITSASSPEVPIDSSYVYDVLGVSVDGTVYMEVDQESYDLTATGQYYVSYGLTTDATCPASVVLSGVARLASGEHDVEITYVGGYTAPTYTMGRRRRGESYKEGAYSQAHGYDVVAQGEYQFAAGKYNAGGEDTAFEVGNGIDDAHRSNAFAVGWDGTGTFAGDVTANGKTLTRTRVKGSAESAYRTGDVNITAANVGAAAADHGHTPASIGAAPSSHTHSTSDITSGTLPIARGGTGKGTVAEARSALGAAAATWTSIASTSGTTAAELDLSERSEVCIVARHGTDYLGSVVLPKAALHASTLREVYLGGWGNNNSSSNRRAVAKVSRARIEPVSIRVDNTDYTDSSAVWTVYAR